MENKLLFNISMQKIKFAFRFSGLNVDGKKRNKWQSLLFVFNLLWLNTDGISAITRFIDGVKSRDNFTQLTFICPFITCSLLLNTKLICLLLNERKVRNLMDYLRNLEVKAEGFVNAERNIIIKKNVKTLNMVVNALVILNFLLFMDSYLCPLVLITVKYFRKNRLELELPFTDIYPFDALNPWIWPYAYIHQFWSGVIIVGALISSDFLFFTCCIHIKIQFKLLQHQFQKVLDFKRISTMNSNDKMAVRDKFNQLIKWHQEIITSASTLEEIYSKSTLVNFLISSIVICFTGFNVVTADDIAVRALFMCVQLMTLSQIFFLCFFGVILTSSSMGVADVIYNSRWYLGDMVIKRNVMIVLARAQQPCKLTAAGFADVELNSFMRILSTSWSYFALLQTINGSPS